MTDNQCIFCRIARGEVPSKKVYEDDDMLAFHDINPVAPVHFMVIPKLHIASFADVKSEHAGLFGRIMTKIPQLAAGEGLKEGWRTIINTGRVGRQDVYHIHIHVVGGPDPLGPMILRAAAA
ncbi:MAG: histidine triad nucleotide-binding protein [Betaproteobacteria bacterium]